MHLLYKRSKKESKCPPFHSHFFKRGVERRGSSSYMQRWLPRPCKTLWSTFCLPDLSLRTREHTDCIQAKGYRGVPVSAHLVIHGKSQRPQPPQEVKLQHIPRLCVTLPQDSKTYYQNSKQSKKGIRNSPFLKGEIRTSLVAQWLGIRLPMQGTWVRALVREDPTGRRATKPVRHN